MPPVASAPRRRPIPGPKPRYPGELVLRVVRGRLDFFRELKAHYGDLAGFTLGRERLVLASHPEAIRTVLAAPQGRFKKGLGLERARVILGNGLLTSEGEEHLRQRRLVQPAFHRERIAGYGRAMLHHANALAAAWARGAPREVELSEHMHALALAIAGETFFGADVTGDVARVGAAVDDAMSVFDVAISPLFPVLRRIPGVPVVRRLERAKRELDDVIARLIAARRAEGPGRDDLLGMLLEARDTEGDGTGMSEQQLRDEILTLLTAGHETTANLLTWACWELANDPLLQDALRAEVQAATREGPLTPAHASQLPLVRAVISETLRLHPPAWIMGRRALVDLELDGHPIPRGTTIVASPWLVHRDPRWWPEADRFNPARWLDAAAAQGRHRFAYFPFGAGVRQCVGDQFAWMEAILIVAAIVSHVRLALPAGASRPAIAASITLRAQRPVPVLVQPLA
jgi:cytochrome P450